MRRLRRSRRNRWLVGVCGGIGERFGLPYGAVIALRLALIAVTFFSLLTPLVYLLAWLLIPEQPEEEVSPQPAYGPPEDDGGPASYGSTTYEQREEDYVAPIAYEVREEEGGPDTGRPPPQGESDEPRTENRPDDPWSTGSERSRW